MENIAKAFELLCPFFFRRANSQILAKAYTRLSEPLQTPGYVKELEDLAKRVADLAVSDTLMCSKAKNREWRKAYNKAYYKGVARLRRMVGEAK